MCLVGFAIEIYYDAWPCECQNCVGNVLQSFGHLSIQNARVQRVCVCVCVDTVCPPRKNKGPHSCYRISLLEWKSSSSVVMIKIYGWVVEYFMCMLYTYIGDINKLLLPNILHSARFNIQSSAWCLHCVYMFCKDLRTNSILWFIQH